MNLIDGIKLKGMAVEIPDCSRDDLPKFFVEMGYKTGVEIGVAKAKFTERFCREGLFIYGIDPWSDYPGIDMQDEYTAKYLENAYELSKRRLVNYKNVKLIRKTSMEAVNDFEDGSLDFVYIDGNHQLKYAIEDLVEWSKKVKIGGVVSGHDYIHPRRLRNNRFNNMHVKFAVDAYTEAYRIENWFLLGRQDNLPGEKRDTVRSWMWIKS